MAAHRKHPPKNAAETIRGLAASGHGQIGIASHLGVCASTFKRWCDEDQKIRDSFELGKEVERQALHALVYESARAGKPANVNAFFLLKARHGYVEADRQSVNVAVALAPVMVLLDHGSDLEWEAKVASQQRTLMGVSSLVVLPESVSQASASPVAPMPSAAPSWKGNA